MAKFIYLYRGPATPMSDFTPEQGAERMAAFGAWMQKVGCGARRCRQPIWNERGRSR